MLVADVGVQAIRLETPLLSYTKGDKFTVMADPATTAKASTIQTEPTEPSEQRVATLQLSAPHRIHGSGQTTSPGKTLSRCVSFNCGLVDTSVFLFGRNPVFMY
jgi:hypothetical protein